MSNARIDFSLSRLVTLIAVADLCAESGKGWTFSPKLASQARGHRLNRWEGGLVRVKPNQVGMDIGVEITEKGRKVAERAARLFPSVRG